MSGFVYGDNRFLYYSSPPAGAVIGIAAKEANRTDYNLSETAARAAGRYILSAATGIPEKNILFLAQEHGERIAEIREYPSAAVDFFAEADGMITALPGLCLVIRTADCVPVFLYDSEKRIAAAVHSGWRGCRAGISGKAVRIMIDEWGSDPLNISAFILPAAGSFSYEVKEDVAEFFPCHTLRDGESLYLDLAASAADSLKSAGLPSSAVFSSDICTIEKKDLFFSHRRGDTGRNLNFIVTPVEEGKP